MTNILIALLFTSTNPASAAVAQSAPATADVKAVEEKKICKRIASTTSRMGSEKICMTAAEWKKQEKNFY